MKKEQIRQWVAELVDSSISESSLAELQDLVKANQDNMDCYLSELELHGLLLQELGHSESRGHVLTAGKAFSGKTWFALAGTVLAVGLCVLGLVLGVFDGKDKTVADGDDSSRTFSDPMLRCATSARITNGRDMRWNDETIRVGSWLVNREYELKSGAVEITFDSGSVLTLEGPSKFEIVSDNQTKLMFGVATADVPNQAVGFSIMTPSGEVIDLSTRFSLTVEKSGESRISVMNGMVEALAKHDKVSVPVIENTAVRMKQNEKPIVVPYQEPFEVEFGQLKNDRPLNFVHYSFDEAGVASGAVLNTGSGRQRPGKIVGGNKQNPGFVQTAGTFGKGVYFSGGGARVETQLSGVSGSRPRTIALWVRVLPGTERIFAYSFGGWGKPSNKIGQKWQLAWNGSPNHGVQGAIRTEFGGGHLIGNTDLRDGRWHHIACVYLGDRDSGILDNVKHYVDGRLERASSVSEVNIDTRTEFRKLVIGDKVEHKTDFFKGYKGWLDEFYMFDAALTPAQIVELMDKNLPPDRNNIVDSFFDVAKP